MAFGYVQQRGLVDVSPRRNIPNPSRPGLPMQRPKKTPRRPAPPRTYPRVRTPYPSIPKGFTQRALVSGIMKGAARAAGRAVPIVGWTILAGDLLLLYEYLTRPPQEEGYEPVGNGWTFVKRNNIHAPDGDKFILTSHSSNYHSNWYNMAESAIKPYADWAPFDTSADDLWQASVPYWVPYVGYRIRMATLWHKDTSQPVSPSDFPYIQPLPEVAPYTIPVTSPETQPVVIPGIFPDVLPVPLPGGLPAPNVRPMPIPQVRKQNRFNARRDESLYDRPDNNSPGNDEEPTPFPRHVRRRPGPNVKERKKHYMQGMTPKMRKALSAVTEGVDFVNCAYEALPSYRKHKHAVTQNTRIRTVYQNWQYLNVDKFIECLIKNHVEDAVIGTAGQYAAKASKQLGGFTGVQTGPHDNAPSVFSTR